MAEELTFHLEEFEGPLELLLALVTKHKMDLHNIPILELIDQYTRAVESAESTDPEISSAFIEMAAHLVEMKPPRFENASGIHGECVGVGSVICAGEYHRMIKKVPRAKPFEPLSEEWIREKFGPLADGIIKENENDVLAAFDPQNIVDNWDAIREIVSNIPTAEEFADVFRGLDGKYRLSDIGIDEALAPEVLDISAAIRNRLTFARMRRVLDFEE